MKFGQLCWTQALPLQRFAFYDIDTPVTLARLQAGDETYLARRQVPVMVRWLTENGIDAQALDTEFGDEDDDVPAPGGAPSSADAPGGPADGR